MSYGIFASYYDLLTGNVNYAGYARRVDRLLKCYGIMGGRILDLACGTANLGIELSKLGYDIIGADISEEMIIAAKKKIKQADINTGFRFFVQDMRKLSLPKIDAAVCSLDALNHLDSIEDIKRCFLGVREHLLDNGVFIFDMNTPYKHEHILSDNTFVYEAPNVYTVWQNRFSPAGCAVDMTLDFFIKNSGGYERHTEKIREKAYRKTVILSALRSCGFEPLGMFDELTSRAPRYDTERILYLAKRR